MPSVCVGRGVGWWGGGEGGVSGRGVVGERKSPQKTSHKWWYHDAGLVLKPRCHYKHVYPPRPAFTFHRGHPSHATATTCSPSTATTLLPPLPPPSSLHFLHPPSPTASHSLRHPSFHGPRGPQYTASTVISARGSRAILQLWMRCRRWRGTSVLGRERGGGPRAWHV